MTRSRKQYDDTSQRPERASSPPPLVNVFVKSTYSPRQRHLSRDTNATTEHLPCETSYCQTRTVSTSEHTSQLFLFVAAENELMKDENVTNFRYSYSYSSPLMMTPASSSTVAVFHRRVGRYRIPITRYLARRAVRRRSSSAVAWRHPSVSVGAPYRSFQFRKN